MGMLRYMICALTALVLVTPPANALTVSGVDVIPGSESLLFVNEPEAFAGIVSKVQDALKAA